MTLKSITTIDIPGNTQIIQYINYTQKSGVSTVEDISYDINSMTMTFKNKPADKTISLQDFFMMIYMKRQYAKQVSLN